MNNVAGSMVHEDFNSLLKQDKGALRALTSLAQLPDFCLPGELYFSTWKRGGTQKSAVVRFIIWLINQVSMRIPSSLCSEFMPVSPALLMSC